MIKPATKPITILLIEDDDGDAKAVQRAFSKAKILNTIERVMDGVDALDSLRGENGRQKLSRPFIVLADLNMPRMNGFEFVKRLREDEELRPSIVFILTTSKQEQDKLAAYQLNVAGYIIKENAGGDFLNLVGLLENYWRLVELP